MGRALSESPRNVRRRARAADPSVARESAIAAIPTPPPQPPNLRDFGESFGAALAAERTYRRAVNTPEDATFYEALVGELVFRRHRAAIAFTAQPTEHGATRYIAHIPPRTFANVESQVNALISRTSAFVRQLPAVAAIRAKVSVLLQKENGEQSVFQAATRLVTQSELDVRRLIEPIMHKYSERAILIDHFELVTYEIPRGAGGYKRPAWLAGKRSLVFVEADDTLCGPRALLLGMMTAEQRKKAVGRDAATLTRNAKALAAKLEIAQDGMAFTDIDRFVERYPEYNVRVFIGVAQVGYEAGTGPKRINLLHNTNDGHSHYFLIRDLDMLFGDNVHCKKKWCEDCGEMKYTANFERHKCRANKCTVCYQTFESTALLEAHKRRSDSHVLRCGRCKRSCPNNECHEAHQATCKAERAVCMKCNKMACIERIASKEHVCGEIYCKSCDLYHNDDNHRCFIKKVKLVPSDKVLADVWVYDFESRFVETDHGSMHEVNYICCKSRETGEIARFGVPGLASDTALDEFVAFALTKKSTTWVAHGAKGYDAWLILRRLCNNHDTRPSKIALVGQKVMMMRIKSLVFLDSASHFATPLHELTETFGLGEGTRKGFYPYRFNVAANESYVGPMPARELFDPDDMKPERLVEFEAWYAERKALPWDNWHELSAYCDQDVNVLCEALRVYSTEALALNGIEPLRSTTTAGYAMKVYSACHMPEDSLAVLTRDEYAFARRAFRGGRTETLRLHREWSQEELDAGMYGEGKDIASQYPKVMHDAMLPCGAPRTVLYTRAEMPALSEVYGIVECDVTCPNDLIHPVLSNHENGRLMSTLLPKRRECYTSCELQQALAVGYKVTRVYRIDHYTPSTDLFKSYIRRFFQLKMEAGDPITDPAELAAIKEKLGFVPDFSAGPNPGRKAIAKMMLNSLWGKFGQNVDNAEQQWLQISGWYRLLSRFTKKEVDIRSCEPSGTWIFTKWNLRGDDENDVMKRTNVALCAFITAAARLLLWTELNKLGLRVLYCDTDSIYSEHDSRLYNIAVSRMLGCWEPEKCGRLRAFASSGKKAYSYKKILGGESSKHKGVTLTARNSAIVNFETIAGLANGSDTIPLATKKLLFERTKAGMRTRETTKLCRNTVTTRMVFAGGFTLPFGFADPAAAIAAHEAERSLSLALSRSQ